MEIVGINLFGPTFPIDYYYNNRFLHLVNFIHTCANCIWSYLHFRTGNDLFYSILLIKVIDNFFEEFTVPHSNFITPLEDCIILDDHNLMAMITQLGNTMWRVNMWLEDKDYAELREALTDIYYAVQYIHLILRFKYYERPGFQVRLEIFDDISKFISSPSEEIFASFPESKLRLGYPEADFNRIYDLIDSFCS
jgi:hypothetical protein